MKRIGLALISFLLTATISISISLFAYDITVKFEARSYSGKRYGSIPYRLLKPENYSKKKSYPLVLFLHGSDERGNDNIKQLLVGLNIFASEKNMSKYPCFIAAPQCPKGMKWTDADWKSDRHLMPKKPTEAMSMALELLINLQKEFSIDSGRIYITGYSMGGFGVWEAIQRRPKLFAAAAPVCGGGDESRANSIKDIPIWAFHGSKDRIVNVKRSRYMINALVKAGGIPRYTEYPKIGHFSWGIAYSDPEMLKWLFKQRKRD